jgi:hypothetical protein
MSEHEGVLELRLAEGEEVAGAVTAALLSLGWPTGYVRASGRYEQIRLSDGRNSSATVTLADDEGGLLLSLEGGWDARKSERLRLMATALATLGGQPTLRGGQVLGLVAADITVLLQRSVAFGAAASAGTPARTVHEVAATRPAAPPQVISRSTPAPIAPARPSTSQGGSMRVQPSAPLNGLSSPPPPPSPAAALDWGAVTAYSAKVQEDIENSDDVDLDHLKRGDVLLHPSLGRCRFHESLGEDSAKVLLPNQSMRKLMMRVFRIVPAGPDRVFNLIKKD